MRKSRFSEEQIIAILKESEAGVETKAVPAARHLQNEDYDCVVCDFLTSTVNLPFGEPFMLTVQV